MPTIAEIASGSDDFNILVNALAFVDGELADSDLIAALSDASGTFTVFAPSDAAFTQLAVDAGFTGNTRNEDAVTNFLATTFGAQTLFDVITYHVLTSVVTAEDIAGLEEVPTLSGGTIGTGDLPTLVDEEPDLLDPSLVDTNIFADNGVIHVIDRVLLPVDLAGNDATSITGIVAASGGTFDNDGSDFDLLLNAVIAADLAGVLGDPNNDLTVFAPNDDAFVGLAAALGFDGDGEGGAFRYISQALTLLSEGDPISLLTAILTYHVAGESLQSSQVLSLEQIDMLSGGVLGVDGASLVDGDDDVPNPNIIGLDIQAENGIIHVIDGVLLPIDVDLPTGDNEFIITQRGADLINAGDGDDLVHSGGGADFVRGGDGNDFLVGGSGGDVVRGGDGNDTILGQGGRDAITGGDGDDTINGGAKRDVISTGEGHDTIVFMAGNGTDVVRDLNEDADIIDISSYGFADYNAFLHAVDITGDDHRTVVDFGDGDRLILRNFDVDTLGHVIEVA